METNKKLQKVAFFFYCEKCDYNTSRKSSYDKHILSGKHKRLTNANEKLQKVAQTNCICICGKKYIHMSSLCKHKQKCTYNNDNPVSLSVSNNENDVSKLTELVMNVVKQNNELTKQIIELSSKPTITNNNTTNNSFNLQFFLNETCKDALNISDFVNQLQLSVKDLETTGRLGYAEGISKIFINGLKQLDINQRPVHCSDSKRETIYIKDSNKWSKETDENIVLTNAIRDVAHKNIQQIPIWTEEHPEHKDLSSKYNDKYMKLVSEAMPGSTKEESDKNYKKIVRNIMKETIIDK
jgi:hypothetical protein